MPVCYLKSQNKQALYHVQVNIFIVTIIQIVTVRVFKNCRSSGIDINIGLSKKSWSIFLCFSKVIYLYKERRSIHDILPVLFDNFLPYFTELYNFLFIKGHVFSDEKLNKVLIYSLVWTECYTMQGVLMRMKQVNVWWHKAWQDWWM